MFKRALIASLCLILALALLAGCQSAAGSADATGSGSDIVGKITVINGNQITLALGTLNQGERPMQEGGNGEPESSANPETTSSAAADSSNGGADATASATTEDSGQQGNPLDDNSPGGQNGSNGSGPGGIRGGSFTESGEEKAITVTNETAITFAGQGDGKTGSLFDLAVGDIIVVTLSGDTATAITVEPSGGLGGGQKSGSDS